jgi:SAM-dependent methyltransferase
MTASDLLRPARARFACVFCGTQSVSADRVETAVFSSNVRAFLQEKFTVWRCPVCRSIHCRDIVNLADYYAKYPVQSARLFWAPRLMYRTLLRRFTAFGMKPADAFLDFGCGSGMFLEYLRERGFRNLTGFDPYSSGAYADRAVVRNGAFRFVLLQDVLEHVEDPAALLAELNDYLAPGGCIQIGTPNAERINLGDARGSVDAIQAPYHLHIPTRAVIEALCRPLGWTTVKFYLRPYHDCWFPGLNNLATQACKEALDGSIDSVLEPIHYARLLTSPAFIFRSILGYWFSRKLDMALMLRKDA